MAWVMVQIDYDGDPQPERIIEAIQKIPDVLNVQIEDWEEGD